MKIHGDLLWFMMTKIVNLKSSAILGVIPLFWQSFQSQGREAVIIHPDLCLVGWFMDHGWPSLEDFSMNHESWMTCGSLWMIQFMNDKRILCLFPIYPFIEKDLWMPSWSVRHTPDYISGFVFYFLGLIINVKPATTTDHFPYFYIIRSGYIPSNRP